MHHRKRLDALERVPILAELSGARLEHLAGTCKWRDYDGGEQILNFHAPSTDVFFLAAAKVRVIIYSAKARLSSSRT